MFVSLIDGISSDQVNSKESAMELGELSLSHQRWEYNDFHLH